MLFQLNRPVADPLALLRALQRAAAFVGDPANAGEVALMLAAPHRIGVDAQLMRRILEGRIRIELGKTHDLAGRRTEALAEYARARALCGGDNDPIGDRAAAELERRPFRFDRGSPTGPRH